MQESKGETKKELAKAAIERKNFPVEEKKDLSTGCKLFFLSFKLTSLIREGYFKLLKYKELH